METSKDFISWDPLFESFPAWNPYHYCFNNPLGYKDPSGLKPEKEKSEKGNKIQIYKEGWVSDQEMQAMIFGIIMEAWESSCKFIDMLNKLDYEVAFGNFRAQISEHQEANRFHRRGGSSGSDGGREGSCLFIGGLFSDSKEGGTANSSSYNNWLVTVFSGLLKASGPFGTADEAAKDFASKYNGLSIMLGVEIGSIIYKGINDNGDVYFSYCKPVFGTTTSADPSDVEANPLNTITVAIIHTHGNFLRATDDEFSATDIGNARWNQSGSYLVTPSGSLFFFDGTKARSNNNPKKIAGMFPCDVLDPTSSRNNKQRYSNYMWGIPSFNDFIKHFFGE